MGKRRNRLSACAFWLLLAALLIHLSAPLLYHACITRVKHQQWARIGSGEAQLKIESLCVDAADFSAAYNHGEKELEIAEMRYDIITYHQIGDKVYCRVLADQHESRLVRGQRQHRPEKETSTKLYIWQALYWQAPDEYRIPQCTIEAINFCNPMNEAGKSDGLGNEESPSPEFTTANRNIIS